MKKRAKALLKLSPKLPFDTVALVLIAAVTTVFTFYVITDSLGSGSKIASVAKSYVGCTEGGSNCDDYKPPGFAWCTHFISYVYRKAGVRFIGGDVFSEGANPAWQYNSVESLQWFFQNYKSDNVKYYSDTSSNRENHPPRVGDVLFWRSGGHANIVTAVSGSGNSIVMSTVGGNESNKVDDDDGVSINSSGLDGWGHFDPWNDMTKDLPGTATATDIGAGKGGVWVAANDDAFKWNGSDWTKVKDVGGSGARNIAVGPSNAWIVTYADNVYRYSGGAWHNMKYGTARDIAISPGGSVYVIDSASHDVYKWNGSTSDPKWSLYSRTDASRIAVSPTRPWIITFSGYVYYRSSGEWVKAGGPLANGDIGISDGNHVWATDTNKSVYRYGSNFETVETGGYDIAVDSNDIPWLVRQGKVYRYY